MDFLRILVEAVFQLPPSLEHCRFWRFSDEFHQPFSQVVAWELFFRLRQILPRLLLENRELLIEFKLKALILDPLK